jgi:hypothetical protein
MELILAEFFLGDKGSEGSFLDAQGLVFTTLEVKAEGEDQRQNGTDDDEKLGQIEDGVFPFFLCFVHGRPPIDLRTTLIPVLWIGATNMPGRRGSLTPSLPDTDEIS